MKIDLTLPITPEMLKNAMENENPALVGHLGTHFDVMDRDFPLEYTELKAIAFDVSAVKERDVDVNDVDITCVKAGMFVAFYTGFSDAAPYGSRKYFKEHPQLSERLIDTLLEKNVSIIGIDCGGVRRGEEHIPTDRRCAARDVFVIENLRNLPQIIDVGKSVLIHTYPIRCSGITGLPCRVIAEL